MNQSSPFPSTLRSALGCTLALFLAACATMTESSSQVRLQQVKSAHVAFIDHHTGMAAPAAWNQANFDDEVARITALYNEAGAAEAKVVAARKEFIKNSSDLFQRDAALVGKNHFVSAGYAANRKKQLQQNYDLLLKH